MRHLYLLAAALMAACLGANAQVVTTSPSPLQEDSPEVTITFHADQGNQGLMGLTGSTDVYAHIGVITNLSDGSWAYAPAWGANLPKYKLSYAGTDTWTLAIGDIRSYFGITNPDEQVQKLAMVFRTADCSREGKTATGGDIFVDVFPDGFHLLLESDAPLVLSSSSATVTFTAQTTATARIAFYEGDASTPFAAKDAATALTASRTFAPGTVTSVTAVATAPSGETARQSIDIVYPSPSAQKPYPFGTLPKAGATAETDGSVTFCLPAPEKTSVMLIPSWDDYKALPKNVMNYVDSNGIRYFWLNVKGLDADTEYPYYYLVDGSISVADPYARLILDPYSDKWLSDGTFPGLIPYPSDRVKGNVVLAVYKGSRDSYDWRIKNFKGVDQDDLIIYELLLRDFTGTEGQARGDGTLALAMQKLDYLKALGINAVELMPVQDFNGNNSWGYNTNFYFAPDKAYGSPDQYRAFIDACHARGMAVILDVVFNQSDGLHPWYMMYPAGSNPFYNERAPHAYSVLNDWKQDNLLVQQQWTDMITYWMTAYKVDGFRFDLVKGLGDNASYGGNASESNTNRYNASRIARMKRLTEVMHAINPYSYSINENLAGPEEENAMAANGQLNWANINHQSGQFAMGFSANSGLNRFYAPDDSRTWGSTVSYAESHDEQRLAYMQDTNGASGVKGNLSASMQRLGSVAAQMLLAPGAHMIWQFGELGNATSTKNSDGSNNTDPKPVLWSYLDDPDRHGLMETYAALADIRNMNPDLFDPTASFSMECDEANWSTGRTIYASTSDKELICVINPTLKRTAISNIKFQSKVTGDYTVRVKSYGSNPSVNAAAARVTLDAGCFVVLTRGNVNAIADVEADSAPGAGVTVQGNSIIADGPAEVFDLTGSRRQPTGLAPGIYIVRTASGTSKIVIE